MNNDNGALDIRAASESEPITDTQQNNARHSPLPWRVIGHSGYTVWSADNIIMQTALFRGTAESKANARLTCKAVNAHAELVAALNDTLRILEAVGYTMQFSNGQKERITRARAALARVKES